MQRYFDYSKVRGNRNSVLLVFINREILPGSGDARICFTFLTTTMDFSEIQISIQLIMIICEILLFILICGILGIKIHPGWDRTFNCIFVVPQDLRILKWPRTLNLKREDHICISFYIMCAIFETEMNTTKGFLNVFNERGCLSSGLHKLMPLCVFIEKRVSSRNFKRNKAKYICSK